MSGPRWLVAAAGEWPNSAIWRPLAEAAEGIIAVDGGAGESALNGVRATVVIGDLDSADQAAISSHPEARRIEDPRQEDSDLVKALKWCGKNGVAAVDVIGVGGGRTDHVLGTFAALLEAPTELAVKLYFADCTATVLGSDPVIDARKGQQVSIFALGGDIDDLAMCGFEYEVESERLSFSTRGLHNTATMDYPEISISDNSTGRLLVMIFY